MSVSLLSSALRALGGPWSLSVGMALWSYPFTVTSVVWVGWVVTGPNLWWFVVATAVHLLMVTLGWLARPLLLPLLRRRPRPALMVAFFALVGWIRGQISIALILGLELQPADQLGWRPLGGAVLMVFTSLLLAWAIEGNHRHRELMGQLQAVGAALAAGREGLSSLLLTDRRQIMSQIDALVTGPIAELRQLAAKGESAAGVLAGRIDALIDDAVKPVSRRLASQVRTWNPTETSAAGEYRSMPLSDIVIRHPLVPGLHGLTLAALGPSVLAVVLPLERAGLASLLSGAAVTAVLLGLDWLRARLIGPRGAGVSTLVAVVASIVATAPVALVLAAFFPPGVDLAGYQSLVLEGMVAIGLGLLVGSGIEQLRTDAEAAVRASNAELAVEVAKISSQLWTQQNRIAQLLHGGVQSALIVAVAKLSAVTRGDVPMPPADELLDPVDRALAQLDTATEVTVPESTDLPGFLEELITFWGPVMQVGTRVQPGVRDVLRESPATSSVLMAIIGELASNAYRHGQSSHLQVGFELVDGPALRLQVVSNGLETSQPGEPGLGSKLLDATAISWSRSFGPAAVAVVADFPVADSPRAVTAQPDDHHPVAVLDGQVRC